jgi:hypothetical protein
LADRYVRHFRIAHTHLGILVDRGLGLLLQINDRLSQFVDPYERLVVVPIIEKLIEVI